MVRNGSLIHKFKPNFHMIATKYQSIPNYCNNFLNTGSFLWWSRGWPRNILIYTEYFALLILPRFGRDPMPFWSYYYLYSWIPKMKRLLPHQIGRNQRLRLMLIKRKGTKEGKIFMSMYVFITCFHESWIFYLILSFWCNCYLYKVI